MNCVGGLAIEISDARGNLISRNAKEGRVMSTFGPADERCLNDADLKVAHATGAGPKAVAAMKYRYGTRGLAGVSLHEIIKADPTKHYPYLPPAKLLPGDSGLNPGDLDGSLVRTVIEPENSDDQDVRRSDGTVGRPVQQLGMGVVYPDGTTNETRAANNEEADPDANLDAALRVARRKKERAKRADNMDPGMRAHFPKRKNA
jgi:hypothetical protein